MIMLTLKFRIARMQCEKPFIRIIHCKDGVSESILIGLFQPFMFHFKHAHDVIAAIKFTHGFFLCFVKIFSISKRLIIDVPTATECFLNQDFLFFVWVYTIFVGFKNYISPPSANTKEVVGSTRYAPHRFLYRLVSLGIERFYQTLVRIHFTGHHHVAHVHRESADEGYASFVFL